MTRQFSADRTTCHLPSRRRRCRAEASGPAPLPAPHAVTVRLAEAAPDATHRGEGARYRRDTNTPSGLWRRAGSLWREPVRPDNEAMLRQTRGVGRVPGGQDDQRARSWGGFRPMRRMKTSTGFTCSSFGGRLAHRRLGTRSSESSTAGSVRPAFGSIAAGTRSAPYLGGLGTA